MDVLWIRVALGTGIAAVVGLAAFLQTGVAEGIEPRLAELRDHRYTEFTAQARARERDLAIDKTGRSYLADLEADFKLFGVPPVSTDEIRKPNRFVDLVDDTKIMGAGEKVVTELITVSTTVEKATFVKQGAQISANHVVSRVTNTSDTPLAYFIEVRSASLGGCDVRASRKVNANALRPGETAEFPVCAGKGKAALHDLKAMVLTPLAYAYISKLPGRALGYDEITARAHEPAGKYSVCSQLPAEHLGRRVRAGELRWDDVIDFFTRHNCERFGFVEGYRRPEQDLGHVPVLESNLAEALGLDPPASEPGETGAPATP